MEKIKAAQIGCGGRNGAHFQKLSSFADVDIVGFCDIIPERAEARRNAYGSGKAYTDYVQMLDETNPTSSSSLSPRTFTVKSSPNS